MKQTCENCRKSKNGVCRVFKNVVLSLSECKDLNFALWQPDYQTLEAQLERMIQGYKNLIEFKIIPERYFPDTETYIKEYEQILTKAKGG